MTEPLKGWTIYLGVPDFPQHYAVVRWAVDDLGDLWIWPFAVLCGTLEEAREQVPPWTILFPREPQDDPTVIETYM